MNNLEYWSYRAKAVEHCLHIELATIPFVCHSKYSNMSFMNCMESAPVDPKALKDARRSPVAHSINSN